MFEKILERVLLSHFGRYLTGFDRNNLKLGVWSGNVVIENVKVKPEIIERLYLVCNKSLELPIELIHSTIGRLVMTVPWNKLSSSPVEVLIEDIYIVIAPKNPKDWDFSDRRLVEKKFNVIMNYAQAQIEKCLTTRKKVEDQQSYFDKLTLKVIDNLQLQVKNIHIRWESKSTPQPFAWGIKLNSLDAFTTNNEWSKQFIDRTDEKNRLTPMKKYVLLDKLIMYWNAVETSFFEEGVPANATKFEKVIDIRAEFKWTQNVRSLFNETLFDVQFDLNQIDISFKHSQLQQLILMLESISLYTKLLWMGRKSVTNVKYNHDLCKTNFNSLFTKIQKSELKTSESLDEVESTQLNDIVRQVDYETLFVWTQSVMKAIILESKVLELQRQRTKKGWFGWSAGAAEGESQVQESEIKELEQYIESTLAQEADEFESSSIVRPPSSIKYKASFILKGASLQVTKEYGATNEGLRLTCKEVKFDLESQQNKDFECFFSVGTLGVFILAKTLEQQFTLTPLCFEQHTTNKFFVFQLAKRELNNMSVRCEVQSVTWVYNPGLVGFLGEMKNVKGGALEESFKSATWNQLEKIQDTTQSRVHFLLASALRLDLNLHMDKMRLVLPNNSRNEAWSLNIEQIVVRSKDKTEGDLYEHYDIVVEKSSLTYGIHEQGYHIPAYGGERVSVFMDYTIEVQFAKLDESVRELVQEKPMMIVSATLQPLKLTLTEKSYRDLIYLPEAIIPPQSGTQRLEQLRGEKLAVIQQQTKSGWIKRRGENIRVWSKFFMILSGGYLYLYDNESALMSTTTVYIKNGLVRRHHDEEFAFTLENRYESCILACEDDLTVTEWIAHLNKQIAEYATEDEYIKLKEEDQQQQPTPHVNKNKLQLELYVESAELTIFKGKLLKEALLYVRAEGVHYRHENAEMSLTVSAKMRSFLLRDWKFNYHNVAYQDLISMHSHKEGQDCLDVQLVQLKPAHADYARVDMKIKCAIEDLQVNWKPDSFLELRALMLIVEERQSRRWYYSQVKDYEVEAITKGGSKFEDLRVLKLTEAMNDSLLKCELYARSEASIKEHFEYFLDFEHFTKNYEWIYRELVAPFYKQQSYHKPSPVIIEFEGCIASAKMNFFQMQSHACLFKVEVVMARFTFRKLQFNNFLACSLHDLDMWDMTNYPFSVDSNKHFAEVVPFKLIGRRAGCEGELVRFRFGGQSELIYPNADRLNVFLLIEINHVFAIYQHQPIMRIIDYIIVQVVSLLRQPEYLTMNAAVLQEKRNTKIPSTLKAKRVWGDLDEIFKKFICPTFMDCRVVIQNPNLQIKGWQHFDQYFQVAAKEILVYNGQMVDNSRLLKRGGIVLAEVGRGMPDGTIQDAWCESYFVEAKELIIQYVDKGDVRGMSGLMNFNLSFQRVLNSNEVQAVYPEIEYDRSLKIRSAMTPIVLKAYRDEYLQVCRMIFHNFQYDDQMDKLLIHDFEVVRSFTPSPISFFLDFTEVRIFAMSSLQLQPLAQICMNRMRLKWIREPSMNIELDIFGQIFSMYNYVESEEGCYEERGFVGDLQWQVMHRLMGDRDGLKLDSTFYSTNKQELQEEFKMYEFEDYNETNVQFTLLFKIIRPIGDKNIYIYLKDVKMIVQLSVFANIGLWSLLDQMCWPPQNDCNTQCLILLVGEIPGLQLFTEIRNVSVCLPTTSGEQVMATKGEISYIFNRTRMPNHQWMMMQQREGKLNARLVQQIGEAFQHKITLQSLELFKCNIDEFVNLPIQEVHKRNIIMPFSFFLGIKNELQITDQSAGSQIYYLNKYECNFDKTVIKFSYQDLIVLIDIIDFNRKQIKLIQREPDQQQPAQIAQPVTPVNNVYDAIIHGLQVVIINDAGEAYVPVFDSTLYESQIIFHQTKFKSILSMVVSLSSTFFNPLIAVWEPIVERCTFALDMSINEISNPKKYVILEMNSPQEILNINLSTQMLSVFHKTYLSWVKEIKQSTDVTQKNAYQSKRRAHQSFMSKVDLDDSMEESKEIFDIRKKSTIMSSYKFGASKLQWGVSKNDVIDSIDHVSPYTIRNETGFLIEVEDDSEGGKSRQKYVVPTGGSANYQIDADIEQVFLKDTTTIKDQRLIKFIVHHPLYQFQEICGVDMDAIRSRKVALKCGPQVFSLYVEVVPKDTRKLLLISSEIMVYNKTDQVVELRLFEQRGQLELNELVLCVEPQRAINVPFDRTKAVMTFRFKEDRGAYSQLINLEQIFELTDRSIEFQHGSKRFTLMRCAKRGTNQTILYLEPPYTIKNCLPMGLEYEIFTEVKSEVEAPPQQFIKNPYYQLSGILKGHQGNQQEIQVHSVSLSARLGIKLKLPYYQQSDIRLLFNPAPPQQPTQQRKVVENIMMCDYAGRVGQIEVQAVGQDGGAKMFYLYVPAFAVNDTQKQLYFYTTNLKGKNQKALLSSGQSMKMVHIAEQSKIVLLGSAIYTLISLSDEVGSAQVSKEMSMNQTGNDCIKLEEVYEFGVNVSLVCVDQSQQLFSKVMTVSPRYVFVNYTDYPLNIIQDDCEGEATQILSQQRVPYNWSRGDRPKLFRAQLVEMAASDTEVLWGYSQCLDPNRPGFTCFTVRSERNRSSVKYVNCQLRVNDQIIYLLFQECRVPLRSLKAVESVLNDDSLCEIPYIIVNNLQDVSLICYQSCFMVRTPQQDQEYQFQEYKTIIPQQTQMPFAWEHPREKNEIVIEFRFEGELHHLFSHEPLLISLEAMDIEKEYSLTNAGKQFKFYIMTQWEGKSKKLKLYQEEEIMERMRQEDIIELQLGVSISSIGISVLDYDDSLKRVELLYITLKQVEFVLLETTVLRTSQLKVKYINIDSNSSSRTMFPVIMTPTKYREIFEFDRPQLSLVIAQSTQAKTLTLLKSIRACLQPTTIRLTSEVLENLYALFKNVQQQLKTNINEESLSTRTDFEYALEFQLKKPTQLKAEAPVYLLNQVQQKYGQRQLNAPPTQDDHHDWQVQELPLEAKITYIDRIEIYPLYFNITFYNSVHSTFQYGGLGRILKTVGIVIGNIDEAPIKLDGIYLENCFDTSAGITQKLATHYKDNLIQQLLKIVGSIEIFGNPVGLVKNIAVGVYDLFDKPIEGFIKGPIEGGIGITKGVGSLVKNTVSGTSNSAGKISGAIAGGFSTISMDPYFQRRRETMKMTKPRQIFDGLTQGLVLLCEGVARGVTGVVILPIDGAHQDGMTGALMGTLKGAAGFFVKPLSGLFDFGSKTAEGIKATAVYWDDKANEKRERHIRVMYAQEQFYKGYNNKDSEVMNYLQNNWKGRYGDINLYDAFKMGLKYQETLLVLSFQYIIFIDYNKKKIIWIIDTKMLHTVEQQDQGIKFILREDDEVTKTKTLMVVLPASQLQQEMFQKSRWLLQSVQAT